MKVKVISLLQPWASLVVTTDPKTGKAYKQIETRSWNTKYRGEIYIHASAGKQYRKLPTDSPLWMNYPQRDMGAIGALPFGAIIGKVNIKETHSTNNCHAPAYIPFPKIIKPWEEELEGESYLALTEEELAFGDYGAGRYGWLLSDPVKFLAPIPAKGQLGIWKWEMPGKEMAP